jgi:ABC-2 type transport system permease protein
MSLQIRKSNDWLKLQVTALLAEFKRAYLLEWRYPLDGIGKLIFLYLLFGAITWGNSLLGPALNVAAFRIGQTERLVGYIYFFLVISTVQNGPNFIREESELGIFEQLCLSPLSLSNIILIRGISTIATNLVPLVILFLVSAWTLTVEIKLVQPMIVLALILGAVGMQGLGFLLSGIALLAKRTQALVNLLTLLLLVLSVTPVAQSQGFVGTLLTWFPFTLSIRLISAGLLDLDMSAIHMIILFTSAIALFGIGLAIFQVAEQLALDRGYLGKH